LQPMTVQATGWAAAETTARDGGGQKLYKAPYQLLAVALSRRRRSGVGERATHDEPKRGAAVAGCTVAHLFAAACNGRVTRPTGVDACVRAGGRVEGATSRYV